MSKIRTLIIEDSALTRSVLERIIGSDANIEVVGTAIDPIIAAKKIEALKPDVITLDLVMPRMDGLTFLDKLMKNRPIPVVIISGNSPKVSVNAIKALELGAFEIIEKPDVSSPARLSEVAVHINMAIKAAYECDRGKQVNGSKNWSGTDKKYSDKLNVTGRSNGADALKGDAMMYAIGASTGGPEVLKHILSQLNPECQGIVVAQHMPPVFTTSFAGLLNEACKLEVVEAEDGERLVSGKVIILPGNYHGTINKDVSGYYIRLNQNDKVNRHRPSVDVLFDSAASVIGRNASGILLTGMGDDGARGLKKMREVGADTIAQSRESSIVYGMPKKAVELGAARSIQSPEEIIEWMNNNIN